MIKALSRAALVGMTAALSLVSAAQAQTQGAAPLPADIQALNQYIHSDAYVQNAQALILSGEAMSSPECKAPVVKSWIGLQVIQKPIFSGPTPVSGAWRDQVLVERCKEKVVYNLLVVAHPDAPPSQTLLMPGDTVLPPKVQRDVLGAIDDKLKGKTCADPVTVPRMTSIGKAEAPVQRNQNGIVIGGKWIEKWTVLHCGAKYDAEVNVTADGKGGANFTLKMLNEPKPEKKKKK